MYLEIFVNYQNILSKSEKTENCIGFYKNRSIEKQYNN